MAVAVVAAAMVVAAAAAEAVVGLEVAATAGSLDAEGAAGAAAADSVAGSFSAQAARVAQAAAYPGERAAGANNKSHDLTAGFTEDAVIGLEAPQAPLRRPRS